MRKLIITASFICLAIIPAFGAKIQTGEELIAAMHAKYEGKWYKTLTFVQKNTQYQPEGKIQNSIWYEAMELPGKLRIDFDPLANKSGMMFVDGNQFMFKEGKLGRKTPLLHPLMVLGFDVYGQPVETTLQQLKDLKFDLSLIHEDTWQGRKVYVVGAAKGDLKSKQFWIDKKNLLFVRSLQPAGPKGEVVSETQFNKYKKIKSGGWISPEVVFLADGKRTFVEEYTEIKTGMDLDSNLFDPEKWADADTSFFAGG
jgi:outer membrane lipoprotein-sorting protein